VISFLTRVTGGETLEVYVVPLDFVRFSCSMRKNSWIPDSVRPVVTFLDPVRNLQSGFILLFVCFPEAVTSQLLRLPLVPSAFLIRSGKIVIFRIR
jgi:hypothetical protein